MFCRGASKAYDAANQCIRRARALADLIALAPEADRKSIETAAMAIYDAMADAERHLDAIWVAIGGKSGIEQ